MRYPSKQAFIEDIEAEWDNLKALLADLDDAALLEPNVCAKWSIKDMLAHLCEWHQLALGWYRTGLKGDTPAMPMSGFKWNQIKELNREFYLKNKDKDLAQVRADLNKSHREILRLINKLSEDQLLSPGHFGWTTKYPLTTYFHANTSGHYRWAIRHIKKWRKSRRAGL